MNSSEKLSLLSSRLRAAGSECQCDVISQQEMTELISQCGGDVDAATYLACLRMAECTALVTPELETESQRQYWLSLARVYRPNKTRVLGRKDEEVHNGGM